MLEINSPHSPKMERSVIGCLLLFSDECLPKCSRLFVDSFFDPICALLYRAIRELEEDGDGVSLRTVTERLISTGNIDQAGGPSTLVEISNDAESPALFDSYLRAVLDDAYRRRVEKLCHETAGTVSDRSVKIDKSLEILEQTIAEIQEERIDSAPKWSDDLMFSTDSRIKETKSGKLTLLDTGFIRLDSLLKGFKPGSLIVLAGRPSMGKTALAVNVAENIASKNITVGILSLEMEGEEIQSRQISTRSGLDLDRILDNEPFSPDEEVKYAGALSYVSGLPIAISTHSGSALSSVIATMHLLVKRMGCKLIVLDYLQQITSPKFTGQQTQWISYVSARLKATAKELQVPLLCLSQLSRDCEKRDDKRPRLSDLRDSGSIEQDADVVMMIYRPEWYLSDSDRERATMTIGKTSYPVKGIAEILIEKNRNGKTGRAVLTWLGRNSRFANWMPDNATSEIASF